MYVAMQPWPACAGAAAPRRPSGPVRVSADDPAHPRLIRAVAERADRQAFATLFAYYAPRVKAYLQRTGSRADQAEELAQEVLLTVWHKAPQYDPARATAAAWVFAIARNRRIDSLRRDRVAPAEPDPTEMPAAPEPADALLAADQQAQRLHAALAGLPADQSEALRLAFFEERSHSEMETALGVPLGTVKSRLRLAMAKLRLALRDDA